MSAWIVSENHIRLLTEAFFKYEIAHADPLTPAQLGAMLWKENHRSVNYHYKDTEPTPAYTHDSAAVCAAIVSGNKPPQPLGTVRELARQPGLLFKQVACYNYQSCERPDWEQSHAYAAMTALAEAIARLAGTTVDALHDAPAFQQGPWGIY